MKLLIILLVSMLFVYGCTSPAPKTDQPPIVPENKPSCKTVLYDEPQIKEECNNVSFTEPVCTNQKLNYSLSKVSSSSVCTESGACHLKEYPSCLPCTFVSSRCSVSLKNLNPRKSGVWEFGANFSLPGFNFKKESIKIEVAPEQSAIFEFFHQYSSQDENTPAACKIYVIKEPIMEDCHQETQPKLVCKNITTLIQKSKQVCE